MPIGVVEKPTKPGPDYVWDAGANMWVYKPPATPTPGALPTATKQTSATAGAGMGTGGKTYDTGNPGAGGIPGQGVAPPKPTNPHRPGSWAADRWDQDHKVGKYAPGSGIPQYASGPPAAAPSTTPIPGAMTAAQMDAMQAPGATQTATAVTRKDGDPGPVAGTVWSSKDGAYVMPAATTTTPPVTTTNTNTSASTNTGQTTTNPVTQTTPTPQEGWTRTEGGKTYKFTGGKWVDAATIAAPAATSATTPPAVPVTPTPTNTEKPIAEQDPTNPLPNALAMGRAVQAEYTPYDLAKFLDVQGLTNDALDVAGQESDAAYQKAVHELRNRYGGAGVSGQLQNNELNMAKDFALGKARTAADIRKNYNDTVFNRGMGMNSASDARASALLSSGLQQNALQVGTTQQERERANSNQQAQLNRDAQKDDLVTRLRHEAGMAEATLNAQQQQNMENAVMNYLFPAPPSPMEQAIMKQAGVPYEPGKSHGVSYLEKLGNMLGIDMGDILSIFGGN